MAILESSCSHPKRSHKGIPTLAAVCCFVLLSSCSQAWSQRDEFTAVGSGGESAGAVTLRRAWRHPGRGHVLAPSPDGNYLAFRDRKTGDLLLRDLTAGTDRRLTRNATPWEHTTTAAAVSPDGRWITYNWGSPTKRAWELRLAALEVGSQPRVLYRHEDVREIVPRGWSPDGKRIVTKVDRKDSTRQIVLVTVADGSLDVVKTMSWAYMTIYPSPDGRSIAYTLQQEGFRRDIFLLATDGSREIALVEHPADDDLLGWAPDSRALLFSSDRSGTRDAWMLRIADGKPQGFPRLVKKNIGAIEPLGVTRGGAFYYTVSIDTRDVYSAKLDAATGKVPAPPEQVTKRSVGRRLSLDSIDIAPDGKHLAYVSQRQPGRRAPRFIVIRSLESGSERELSPPANLERFGGMLRWSPDGSSILFVGRGEKGRGIYQIAVETGQVTPVVERTGEEFVGPAVWSPDGTAIFYYRWERQSKTTRILERSLASRTEKELYRSAGPDLIGPSLALSPDGRRLAFPCPWFPERGATALKVIPTTGGEARDVLTVGGPRITASNGGLAWSRDGRRLIYGMRSWPSRISGDTIELRAVSADSSDAWQTGLAMEGLRDLSLYPDGRRIAFVAAKRLDEVWVMESFLPEVAAAR